MVCPIWKFLIKFTLTPKPHATPHPHRMYSRNHSKLVFTSQPLPCFVLPRLISLQSQKLLAEAFPHLSSQFSFHRAAIVWHDILYLLSLLFSTHMFKVCNSQQQDPWERTKLPASCRVTSCGPTMESVCYSSGLSQSSFRDWKNWMDTEMDEYMPAWVNLHLYF